MTEKKLIIPAINIGRLIFTIKGISPLIVNKFVTNLETKEKIKPTPQKQFEDSIHYCKDGSYGFPAKGIQWAIINACRLKDDGVKNPSMAEMKGIFTILPVNTNEDVLKLDCSKPVIHQRVVYNMGKNAILHYMAKFEEWQITFLIQYPEGFIDEDVYIYNLKKAGLLVGLGVESPRRTGTYGRFEIISVKRYK